MPKKKDSKKKLLIPTFHMFCEGEKTEPYYINGYLSHFHSEKRNIFLIEDTKKNTPVQLVVAAINHKETTPENDLYWVVFDRESTVKYSHKLHLKAMTLANKYNINIALSNVCFEFWLLLHFTQTTASYSSCQDLLSNSKLKAYLKTQGIEKYDKGLPLLFDALKTKITDAKKNAKIINQQAINAAEHGRTAPCYLNPYTNVNELFIAIDDFAEQL